MGIGSTVYKLVFMLHILAIVIGFGGVMLNGVYGAEARKRKGATGHAVGEANLRVSRLAVKIILTIPVWGILLVILSDGVWKFDQLWVGLALALFIATMGFATAVQVRNQKRMVALAGELVAAGPPPADASGPPPQVAEMEDLEKRLGMGGAFLSVMVVVLLFLMVFKPGV
ncbi:MAG TPA: DUF2269 family protein [Acidimicrobiales bacterium]|nr:DUF2269 family protein [Acidimicrobiales bacterium]